MTRSRKTSIHGPPLTSAEASGIPKATKGRLIICYRCGRSGGTLVKVSDTEYCHTGMCPKEK